VDEHDGGDSDTTVITFAQPANGVGAQTFRVCGSIEWGEFVLTMLNLDRARKGKPPVPPTWTDDPE